ncbi:hypothetical protein SBF1_7080002 [Candidatus Desulfosporosinus infrequens]|uniref:Uncharacterized protein n=1 Tax=Candidatus Desulfosporosinus infrequens TaxID=2043169 RepID=A0A2U3LPV9_9FIRM|nr:hypothetical protein SBF1_7080002 [Candidatus Desulfosporosinus infrequens]
MELPNYFDINIEVLIVIIMTLLFITLEFFNINIRRISLCFT